MITPMKMLCNFCDQEAKYEIVELNGKQALCCEKHQGDAIAEVERYPKPPSDPEKVYGDKWQGWDDFLGIEKTEVA